MNEYGYGNDMNAYRAAGELAGITSLVDAFYSNMDGFPEARVIRNMHPEDLTESRKKLTGRFRRSTQHHLGYSGVGG